MSTCNFKIEHRCVVVTDEDYEMGNYPSIDDSENLGDRNYPSYRLSDHNDELLYFAITMNCGYFNDANIDYVGMDFSVEHDLLACDISDYASKREFFDCVCEDIAPYHIGKKVSRWKMEKVCRGKDLYECCRILDELFSEIEEKECNKRIDGIKQAYGFGELVCNGVMSNGEGVYSRVG